MWEYTDKVKEYFFNPKNAGELAEANGVGEVGSISCGDALKLMIKVDPATDVITDAAFLTFGCGSAIASSSALTELVKGKTTAQALALSNQDIADFLGGLPPEKMHCSVMGAEALRAAVANYRGEALEEDDHEDGALVCKCFGIDTGVIERAVRGNKLKTLEEVTHFTKAGGSCKTCHERIEEVLIDTHKAMVAEGLMAAEDVFGAKKSTAPKPSSPFVQIGTITKKSAAPAAAPAPVAAPAADAPKRMTMVQKIKLIEEAIESIRPTLKADGGDIELIDVDGDNVLVKLTGACSNCQLARVTVDSIQHRIIEALGRPVRVIPTSALS